MNEPLYFPQDLPGNVFYPIFSPRDTKGMGERAMGVGGQENRGGKKRIKSVAVAGAPHLEKFQVERGHEENIWEDVGAGWGSGSAPRERGTGREEIPSVPGEV